MNKFTTRTLQGLTAAAALTLAFSAHAATDALTGSDTNPATHQTLGDHVDNAAVTAKVKSKLLGTSGLTSTHIHVKTHGSTVWLHGSVPTTAEKNLAVEAARSVEGVSSVHSRLRVNAHPDKTWFHAKEAKVHDATSSSSTSTDDSASTTEHH